MAEEQWGYSVGLAMSGIALLLVVLDPAVLRVGKLPPQLLSGYAKEAFQLLHIPFVVSDPSVDDLGGLLAPVLGEDSLHRGRQGPVLGRDVILYRREDGIDACKTTPKPDSSRLPALAKDVRQHWLTPWGHCGLLLLQCLYKLPVDLIELVEIIPCELVDAASREPVGDGKHLDGQGANPLQINEARDVLVVIDEDITCMEVGELEIKWPAAMLPQDVAMRECPEQRPRGHLAGSPQRRKRNWDWRGKLSSWNVSMSVTNGSVQAYVSSLGICPRCAVVL